MIPIRIKHELGLVKGVWLLDTLTKRLKASWVVHNVRGWEHQPVAYVYPVERIAPCVLGKHGRIDGTSPTRYMTAWVSMDVHKGHARELAKEIDEEFNAKKGDPMDPLSVRADWADEMLDQALDDYHNGRIRACSEKLVVATKIYPHCMKRVTHLIHLINNPTMEPKVGIMRQVGNLLRKKNKNEVVQTE